MPHHNCHLIEMKLHSAEKKLERLFTDINIHQQYLKTHPGHPSTIKLLAELRQLARYQETEVMKLKSDLENCEAQNDRESEKGD